MLAVPLLPVQGSFDDLGAPLHDVTFVVLDLETTGATPDTCAITEVGAVKYRAGECLGTFHTLVNPGTAIPPFITVLTGITEAMVLPAPPIEQVLPAFVEFLGGAVIVGHNVRFDCSFLDASLGRHGFARLTHLRVDTLPLARRLMRDEVPDCKLGTLARALRVRTAPTHRALDDARATAEVFHSLLERAAAYGVLGLDDLVALPTLRAHPSSAKLRLTTRLPRAPGVYRILDAGGRALYVGKATNLRTRVRSYFGHDERRKVPQLLREMKSLTWIECADPLEAAVRELRLIQRDEPRFNRQFKGWRSYAYAQLTLGERFPRLTPTRGVTDNGALYLGPFRSQSAARAVIEAIESALPLRRCATRVGRRATIECGAPCAPAQLGVACCPCRGHIGEDAYADVVRDAVHALTTDPRALFEPLEQRMATLVEQERFEEAALTRDRLALLARTVRRARVAAWLRDAGRLRVRARSAVWEIDRGRLILDGAQEDGGGAGADCGLPSAPPAKHEIDELLIVGRWLETALTDRTARVEHVGGCASEPVAPPPRRYEPVPRRGIRRSR